MHLDNAPLARAARRGAARLMGPRAVSATQSALRPRRSEPRAREADGRSVACFSGVRSRAGVVLKQITSKDLHDILNLFYTIVSF